MSIEDILERMKIVQEEIDKYKRLAKKSAKFRVECLGLVAPSTTEKGYDDNIMRLSQQLSLLKEKLRDARKV